MKKLSLALGVLMLLVGTIIITNYNIQQEVNKEEEVNKKEYTWNISGNLSKGEKLGLYFVQPKDWAFGPYPEIGGPPYSKKLIINVTNTSTGNFTLFEVTLMVPYNQQPPREPYSFTLTIYDVEVAENSGALTVETHPKYVGYLIALGETSDNGEYKMEMQLIPSVVIDEFGNPQNVSPPLQLVLYKVWTERMFPYFFFLPLGIIIIFAGIVLLTLGLRKAHPRSAGRQQKCLK